MKVSIIVLTTNQNGDCGSFNTVLTVIPAGELDLNRIRTPSASEIQNEIAKALDSICNEIKKHGLKVNSHSHCIFE